MARLQIKGLETIEPSSGRPLYHERDYGRKLFKVRQWWDKKQAQYINVLRVHIVRSCGDVDLLIPASGSELELDFVYEDTALFEFRSWRGVERIAVADHHTLEILGEYIFPTRPGQAPTLKQYAGLASCRTAGPLCFYKLYTEEGPDLDLGDLSAVHARWDLMLCNDSIDYNSGEIDTEAMEDELRQAKDDWLRCKVLCASDYCLSRCNETYKEQVQAIYDKYGVTNPGLRP